MRDAAADADDGAALLARVERGAPAGSCADDDGLPLASAVARALAEHLHPGPAAPPAGDRTAGWRAVVAGVHRRAVGLAGTHPASWTLATSSAVLVDDWVRGGTWAAALREALVRDAAGAVAVRDAPVVVALHLFAVRPPVAARSEPAGPAADLSAYPHVTRLRALLSRDGPPEGHPADPAAPVAAVERLLR